MSISVLYWIERLLHTNTQTLYRALLLFLSVYIIFPNKEPKEFDMLGKDLFIECY